MYSAEQRAKAVEAFARFGCSAADTIAELGCPSRVTLRNWWKEYQLGGDEFLARKHHFRAGAPNELWITDVTEFRIPAGKTYLSPIIDCFDGMPISWTISATPDAEMANSSLLGACSQLKEGEHPKGHSDRGCHYRWPGWIRICDDHGIVRSMSRKGCNSDNARAEGFFGRLKIEFFYGRDWNGVTLDEFADMLDAYLGWYRDVRLKSDLDYRSPMQYRRDLGLIA